MSCSTDRARSTSNAVPRPAGQTILGQLHGLALNVRVPHRDGELPLRAAQLEVGPRDFGGEAQLHVLERMLRRLDERAAAR